MEAIRRKYLSIKFAFNRKPIHCQMKKLRKQARVLLQTARKVYHYRCDCMTGEQLKQLDEAIREVYEMVEDRATSPEKFKATLEHLEALLRKLGGKIYPKTFMGDNLETILVAAIIVIGIRTFFFQPFIIPTNSMYPTYHGITSKIYEKEEASPNLLKKAFRFAILGARHRSIIPKESGDVKILLVHNSATGKPDIKRTVRGGFNSRGWFPTLKDEYLFRIADKTYPVVVPRNFDMQSLLGKAFGQHALEIVPEPASEVEAAIPIHAKAVAGEPLLRFDIKIGDALFVDRMTYHFRKPKIGDPFVFRTNSILKAIGDATGDYTPKYYIKRLSGKEHETLTIQDGRLFANDKPRDEVEAFVRNAERQGEYGGYLNQKRTAGGRSLQIPENSFVALGDNSGNSADSRHWGFVPEKAVIGKAFFIYYPFTRRWGIAE